jgi:hypothetical protein
MATEQKPAAPHHYGDRLRELVVISNVLAAGSIG